MNRPTSVYLASITGSFWLVLAGLLVVDRGQIAGGWHAWLPLLGVAMIAEAFEVVTGDGAGDSVMSFSGGAHVAAVILFGPVIAAVIAASAVVLVDGVRAPSPRMVAANAALFGWASLVAGVAYQLAGGTVGSVSVASAVALVVLVVTRGLVNITVFSVGEALASETSPWLAVRGTLADGAVTYAGEGGLGVLVAAGWSTQRWVILPFLVPLFGALYAAKANLERLRAETGAALGAFARVIDERDPNTARHTERVADYVARFVRSIGLPAKEAARLVEAARYHDLGKIAVDEATLSKPGRLNDAEVRAIRRHPRMSATLLSPFGFARDIARYVELHHERYDGRGYYSVVADEIPLEAHVLIVADSFDAMTSTRAYRPALTHEEATQELVDKAGRQFHPEVAIAFAAMIRGDEPAAALPAGSLASLRGGFERITVWPRLQTRLWDDPRMLLSLLGGVSMLTAALAPTSQIRVGVLAAAPALCLPAAWISLRRHRRMARALTLVTRGLALEDALRGAGISGRAIWLRWCPDDDAYCAGASDADTEEACRRAVRSTGGVASRLGTGRHLILSGELGDRSRLAVITVNEPSRVDAGLVERLAQVAPQPAAAPAVRPERAPERPSEPTGLLVELHAFERVRTGAGQLAAHQLVRDAVDAVGTCLRAGDLLEVVGDDTLLVWVGSAGDDRSDAVRERVRSTLAAVAMPKRIAAIDATVRVASSRTEPVDLAARAALSQLAPSADRPEAVGE